MKLLIDPVEYNDKPLKSDAGIIKNRITNYPVDVTPVELANEIKKGKTICAGYIQKRIDGKISCRINNWLSQELICLDFDNEMVIPDPNDTTGKKMIKQKKVTMTIEQALNEFKDIALFIYTSFSHTEKHPKFRVVIRLNRPVNDYKQMVDIFDHFKEKYPYADKKCFEGSHLFYGGRNVHVLNVNNTYNIDTLRNLGKSGVHYSKVITSSINVPPICTPSPRYDISNIELISRMDYIELNQRLKPVHTELQTYDEVYNHLKQQDMATFLDLPNRCSCPFHHDPTPSAHIYRNKESNDSLFKCHDSDECGVKGNIIMIAEKIILRRNPKVKRPEVIEFLKKVFSVELKVSEWIEKQKYILEECKRFIVSDDLENYYPRLYKMIKTQLPYICSMIDMNVEYLKDEMFCDGEGNSIFYKDLRSITKRFGLSSVDKTNVKIKIFTYLGLINKVREDDIPDVLWSTAKSYKTKNKNKYLSNFYSIPSYTVEVSEHAEQKAIEWKEHGYTQEAFSSGGRETILRGHGIEMADKLFPNMVGEEISELNDETTKQIIKSAMELVEEKGWTTEKEILEHVKMFWRGQKQYKNGQMKRMRSELYSNYGLKKRKLNKQLAEMLNIQVKYSEDGNPCYPVVIFK